MVNILVIVLVMRGLAVLVRHVFQQDAIVARWRRMSFAVTKASIESVLVFII